MRVGWWRSKQDEGSAGGCPTRGARDAGTPRDIAVDVRSAGHSLPVDSAAKPACSYLPGMISSVGMLMALTKGRAGVTR